MIKAIFQTQSYLLSIINFSFANTSIYWTTLKTNAIVHSSLEDQTHINIKIGKKNLDYAFLTYALFLLMVVSEASVISVCKSCDLNFAHDNCMNFFTHRIFLKLPLHWPVIFKPLLLWHPYTKYHIPQVKPNTITHYMSNLFCATTTN